MKKNPTSFVLEDEDLEILRRLARKWDRSHSSVMRLILRERGQQEGVAGPDARKGE